MRQTLWLHAKAFGNAQKYGSLFNPFVDYRNITFAINNCMTLTLVLASALLIISQNTFASEARFGALGNVPTLVDNTNVFDYPASQARISQANLELGGVNHSSAYGGAIYSDNKTDYGIYFSRDDFIDRSKSYRPQGLVTTYLNNASGAGELYATPVNPIEFLYVLNQTKSKAMGFKLGFAQYTNQTSHEENKDQDSKRSAQKANLGFGYTAKGSSRIDFGIDIGILNNRSVSSGADDTAVEKTYEENLTLMPRFRNIIKSKTGFNAFSVELVYASPKIKINTPGEDESVTAKETGIFGSYDIHTNLGDRGTLITGFGLNYLQSEAPLHDGTNDSVEATDELLKQTIILLDATLALEMLVTESFGAMASMNPFIYGTSETKNNIDADKPKTTTTLSPNDQTIYSFGFFYSLENFRLDARYASGIFYNGPQFITGNQSNSFITEISIGYVI